MRVKDRKIYFKYEDLVALTGLQHADIEDIVVSGFLEGVYLSEGDESPCVPKEDALVFLEDYFEGLIPGYLPRDLEDIPNTAERRCLLRQLKNMKIPIPKAAYRKLRMKPPTNLVPPDEVAPKSPDVLPFKFTVGSLEPKPVHRLKDLQRVKGCFGFLDETNPECNTKCPFKDPCGAVRVRVMKLLAQKMNGQEVSQKDVLEVALEGYQEFQENLQDSP